MKECSVISKKKEKKSEFFVCVKLLPGKKKPRLIVSGFRVKGRLFFFRKEYNLSKLRHNFKLSNSIQFAPLYDL